MSGLPPSVMTELAQLHAETREELVRLDAKVSTLFSASTLSVSIVVTGVIAGSWKPTDLAGLAEWIWWIGSILVVTSIWLLLSALIPRHQHSQRSSTSVRFYRDVARFPSKQAFFEALVDGCLGSDRVLDQTYELSRLVVMKAERADWSIRTLVAGLFLAALGGTFG